MARSVNYDKKIADLDLKLAANREAAKKLTDERDRLLAIKKGEEVQVVLDFMEEEGISVIELMKLAKAQKQNQS